MLHLDPRFSPAVTESVGAIERRSDAEIVVVVVGRSGAYRDLAWAAALGCSLVALGLLAWAPWEFAGVLFPVYATIAAAIAGFTVARSAPLTRLLAGKRRMQAQVREAAEAAFVQETVHGTRRRTGVLVYVSSLEARVEVLPDQGILGRVPGAALADLDLRAGSLDELVGGLRRLGDLLATHVPPVEGDNPNEVDDAPRVRA